MAKFLEPYTPGEKDGDQLERALCAIAERAQEQGVLSGRILSSQLFCVAALVLFEDEETHQDGRTKKIIEQYVAFQNETYGMLADALLKMNDESPNPRKSQDLDTIRKARRGK